MKLITKQQEHKLLSNWPKNCLREKPVLKIFTPDSAATWLISAMEPQDRDILFGLCDLGLDFPEIGYISLSELRTFRGRLNLPVERDRFFVPTKTLQEYCDEASISGRITV